MKFGTVITLFDALVRLDGQEKTIQDQTGVTRVITVPYAFSSSARIKIARLIAQLKPEVEAYQDAANSVFKEVAKDGKKIDPEDRLEYADKIRELQLQDIPVQLPTIHVDELNLAANAIPQTVIAELVQLVDWG